MALIRPSLPRTGCDKGVGSHLGSSRNKDITFAWHLLCTCVSHRNLELNRELSVFMENSRLKIKVFRIFHLFLSISNPQQAVPLLTEDWTKPGLMDGCTEHIYKECIEDMHHVAINVPDLHLCESIQKEDHKFLLFWDSQH